MILKCYLKPWLCRNFDYKNCFRCEFIEDQVLINNVRKLPKKHRSHHLIVQGLPPGTEYDLYSLYLDEYDKPAYFGSGYINEQGEAMLRAAKKDVKLADIYLKIGPTLPGEIFYYLLMTEDTKVFLVAKIVANPIEAFGINNRYVYMEIPLPTYEDFFIQGHNFQPNQTLFIKSQFDKDPVIFQCFTDDKGHFCFHHEMDEKKIGKGQKEVLIYATDMKDPMKLQFYWPEKNYLTIKDIFSVHI